MFMFVKYNANHVLSAARPSNFDGIAKRSLPLESKSYFGTPRCSTNVDNNDLLDKLLWCGVHQSDYLACEGNTAMCFC
jgi:hypothetical protein